MRKGTVRGRARSEDVGDRTRRQARARVDWSLHFPVPPTANGEPMLKSWDVSEFLENNRLAIALVSNFSLFVLVAASTRDRDSLS